MKRAAGDFGGFILEPPIEKSEAEAQLCRSVSDETWLGIRQAYHEFGDGMDALTASHLSRKKDDPNGWYAQQVASVKDLETALDRIGRVKNERERFVREAEENYFLETSGSSSNGRASQWLASAYMQVLRALTVIERAQPREVEVLSESRLRKRLARDIFKAFQLDVSTPKISDGRALGMLDGVSEADLTEFERFLSVLEIHNAETPNAFSRWVRDAMGEV